MENISWLPSDIDKEFEFISDKKKCNFSCKISSIFLTVLFITRCGQRSIWSEFHCWCDIWSQAKPRIHVHCSFVIKLWKIEEKEESNNQNSEDSLGIFLVSFRFPQRCCGPSTFRHRSHSKMQMIHLRAWSTWVFLHWQNHCDYFAAILIAAIAPYTSRTNKTYNIICISISLLCVWLWDMGSSLWSWRKTDSPRTCDIAK